MNINNFIRLSTVLLFIGICETVCSQTPDLKSLRESLQPYVDAGDIPGVVTVVASPDKVLSMECFGYQDIARNRKMTPDALFWMASQSKPVTAVAVMMLVDEDKVSLDEPVTTYLPELNRLMVSRVKRDGWQVEELLNKPVTLRHLLSHTGGMKWVATVQEQMGKIDVMPLQMSLYASNATPLLTEPGEAYSYSNQGINVAAAVVERVSGMSFPDFLQTRLFDPLGMQSATFWPTEKQLAKLAAPYTMDETGKLKEITINQLQYPLNDRMKRHAEAAGGLFCAPVDWVKFYQMLANKGVFNGKRYLSEAAIEELGKKQTGEKLSASYGLGFAVSERYMGHAGSHGTDSNIDRKLNIIVMYFIQQENIPKHEEAKRAFLKQVEALYGSENK
ncbi:MAG: beta-lactamase family protein [Tannerella sp.]|jgi:CubicO group peptidase (beta-lactamase class C family)|nr:beta-lactamase family protein [Tannerella sp.]